MKYWSIALILLLGIVLSGTLVQADAPKVENTSVLVGVTDVDQAMDWFQDNGYSVKHIIRPIKAIAVHGDVSVLNSQDFIRYIEPDPPDAVSIVDGPSVEDVLDYGVDNINSEVVWGGAEDAVNVIPGEGGAGMKVGIVDTGIDCTHEDLAPDCNFGANFVNPPFQGDDHGHGTHVAGLTAARDNATGTIGTAPEASLYAVKVLSSSGSGSWSGVAAGIVWSADNGMDVINMSLGGSGFNQGVQDAVDYAHGNGVLVVSAAGNSSGCSTCQTVLYPAKYLNSMAIAAVDSSDNRASFSSTGPEVDVSAPGVSNLAPVPTGSCSLCDPTGYKRLSGTSMATPHTAGAGAILMSRGLNNVDARARLRDTSIDRGAAGFDWLYGCGRIDVKRAVDNTGTGCGGAPPPPTPTPTPVPPEPSCSASFDGTVHHKDPSDSLHVFNAPEECSGNFVFSLHWHPDKKDLRLTVIDPSGNEFVSDCCFPEKITRPAQSGGWQLFAGTNDNGRVTYSMAVVNP